MSGKVEELSNCVSQLKYNVIKLSNHEDRIKWSRNKGATWYIARLKWDIFASMEEL